MLANAFTSTTSGGFAAAYNNASTDTGELGSGFFTVSANASTGLADPSTFQVNTALLNGTSTVKQASASAVVSALSAVQTYPPTSPTGLGLGLTANSTGDYADMTTAVLSYFQQAANTVKTQSTAATQQQTYYQQTLSNATGVNVDTELVNLTTLQNSYAASAHVISTINQMYTDLENIVPS
jgi:flagellar hook-associated protein 1 FlgK